MQRRRCAAMLDHRGCNDDASHPRPDHRGTRRTAALSKVQSGGFCVPNGLELPAKLLALADEIIE